MKKLSSKDFVGINLKARIRNKYFLSSLVSVIALIISKVALDFYGVDLSLGVQSAIEVAEYVLYILVLFGVVVDPTVEGFSDSEYSKRKDKPSGRE